MKAVSRSVVIGASPAQVWGILSQFDKIAEWAPNVDHSCCLTRPLSGMSAARRVQLGRMVLVERIFEWETDSHLSYRIEGLPEKLGVVTNTWSLAPKADRTEVTLTTNVDVGSRPPQRLIEAAVARKLASASDELLAGLANECGQRGSN